MSETTPSTAASTGTGRADAREDGADGTTVRGRLLDGLQALLGLVLLAAGGSKLAGTEGQVRAFERWGYPQWFRVTTGGIETLAGFGLLAGRVRPVVGVAGGGLALGTMLGAVYTHLVRVRDPPSEALPATVLLALAAVVTGRRLTGPESSAGNGEGRRG